MALIEVARKSRMVAIPEETDICSLLFQRPKTIKACRLFLDWLKTTAKPSPKATRHEISQFGWDLKEGRIEQGFMYGRKAFYGTILRRLVDLGFIGLRARVLYLPNRVVLECYVPIHQPIPKNSPSRKTFWNIAWHICRKWNEEWAASLH